MDLGDGISQEGLVSALETIPMILLEEENDRRAIFS